MKTKDKVILIIAAHPDDELLGCGGTICQYIEKGAKAYSIILGEGMMARGKMGKEVLNNLWNDARKANKHIGIEKVHFDKLPDNQFDKLTLLEVVRIVEKYITQYQPDIIFTHHAADLNIDHRITFQAVMTACRPQPKFKHPDIYSFEVVSSTDYADFNRDNAFIPNVYVDIGPSIDRKIEALAFYKTEMRDYPHSRSLEGIRVLAKSRGVRVGLEYAEAFQLIRKVECCG